MIRRAFLIPLYLLLCLVLCPCVFSESDAESSSERDLIHRTSMPGPSHPVQSLTLWLSSSWPQQSTGPQSNASVSAQCRADLEFVLWSLAKKKPWAIQMLDSYGKLPPGVMNGAFAWPGDFRQCVDIRVPPWIEHRLFDNNQTDGFQGTYCSLQWNVTLMPNMALPLTIGICIPDSCNADDVHGMVSKVSDFADFFSWLKKFQVAHLAGVDCKPKEAEWSAAGIISVCLFVVVACLLLVGTIWDVVHSRRRLAAQAHTANDSVESGAEGALSSVVSPKASVSSLNTDDANPSAKSETSTMKVLRKVFFCFSVYTNGRKLLDTSHASGQLTSLHGIRFLSMCWVILGHTYYFAVTFIGNSSNMLKDISNAPFQAVAQGPLSVDTFFMLSGLLLTYLFMKEATRVKGKINWFYFYLHRWWRLSPVYYILMVAFMGIWSHTGSGPFWQYHGWANDMCSKYWWRNVLYINNINSTKSCLGWSWYMANDMQFYIISPLFLWPLFRWPLVGLAIAGTLMIASWIATFVISYNNNFLPLLSGVWDVTLANAKEYMEQQADFFDTIYVKPYCRIATYIIGVYLGYVLYKAEEKNYKVPAVSQAILWLLSTALCLSTIYGLYGVDMGNVGNAFFNALSRTAFILGISWVVFACIRGHGGFINDFLSWKFWVPLSRLTYCAYLIHPMILLWSYAGSNVTINFSQADMVRNYFGFLILSYGLAAVFSLAFEAPMMGLEKLLLRAEVKKTSDRTKQ